MAAAPKPCYTISQAELDSAITQLGYFVEIPSVSNPNSADYSKEKLNMAAKYCVALLDLIDFKSREVTIDDSAPFILAEKIVDTAKPTLLLYAHYDVQPVDRDQWTSDPFVMEERDGRLYGRGASDDKGGIIGIITALGAYQKHYGALPVNVKILFEGEEEYGSSHMKQLIQQEKDHLAAHALVILDGANVDTKTGTLTSSTRGVLNLTVEVRAMKQPVHSGIGCIAPDPSLALAHLMTSCADPKKIPGFMEDCETLKPEEREILQQSSQTAEEYIEDLDLLPNSTLRGDPNVSIYERISLEPSITFVNGGWGKPNGGNSIQDIARFEMSIRLAAGQNPETISKVMIEHLTTNPNTNGFEVTVTPAADGAYAWKADLSRDFSKLYMQALSENFLNSKAVPCGGALPLLHDFQETFPNMEMIIPGVEDPKCAAHSHNESQDIGLFECAINSLISFIHKTGQKPQEELVSTEQGS